MKAPFPWFGGKSRAASLIWSRFGDVPNYVEPFAGSLAVLLARPHAPKTETVNDADCYLANFWRAVANDPESVARWADWPVNEADLHARHLWLVNEGGRVGERLRTEPDFFDAKVAGWWVWGVCQWLGRGWCGEGAHWRQLPHLGNAGRGIHKASLPSIHDCMRALQARMRRVRVVCGDWSRVTGEGVTVQHGPTAVLLDPPYSADEHAISYSGDEAERDVAAEAREWALDNGGNRLLRIALCGYDGEHDDLAAAGWAPVRWKAKGGYGSQGDGRGRANAARETIWFSPHCLHPERGASLFDVLGDGALAS